MDKSSKDKYKFNGSGLTTKEKNWARKRFNEYIKAYHIETLSDLQLLEELVFREALQERTKEKISELEKNKTVKEKNVIPHYLTESLDSNLDQIFKLKEKLGLFEEKKVEEGYTKFVKLQKKFKKWCEENQGSRYSKCPHCSKPILWLIRTEAWEHFKHPFFKDNYLANEHLWKLYKEGKITKLDVAKVLQGAGFDNAKNIVSTDYIDWLEKKIFNKEESSS